MKQLNNTDDVLRNAMKGLQPELPKGMTKRFMTRMRNEKSISRQTPSGPGRHFSWRIATAACTAVAAAVGSLLFLLPWQQTDNLPSQRKPFINNVIQAVAALSEASLAERGSIQKSQAYMPAATPVSGKTSKPNPVKATAKATVKATIKTDATGLCTEKSQTASLRQQPAPQDLQESQVGSLPSVISATEVPQWMVADEKEPQTDADAYYTPEERLLMARAEQQQEKAKSFTAEITAMAKIEHTILVTPKSKRQHGAIAI